MNRTLPSHSAKLAPLPAAWGVFPPPLTWRMVPAAMASSSPAVNSRSFWLGTFGSGAILLTVTAPLKSHAVTQTAC